MALVDGNYCYIHVDVGAEGKWVNGGVWGNCDFLIYIYYLSYKKSSSDSVYIIIQS